MSEVGGFIEDSTGINMGNNSATDKAIRAQKEATGQANSLLSEQYQDAKNSFSRLANGSWDYQQDPGYQMRMQEGMKALEGSAAARGNLNSGATMKALTRFGQDFGAQEYGKAYDREFGRISALAGIGSNYANQTGSNLMGMANAQGAAGIAQANMLGNHVMQGGSVLGGMLMSGGQNKSTPAGGTSVTNNGYAGGAYGTNVF